MDLKQEAIREIERASEEVVAETLDFIKFLTLQKRTEQFGTALASESVLRREWDTPEEDDAWKSL